MLKDIALYEFNSLNDNEKHEALMEYATNVGERSDGCYRILLYQFTNFYVELFYYADENKIDRFRSFKTDSLLTPYLNQFDLGELNELK